MRIEHVAIWTKDIEVMKHFYTKYFNAESEKKYVNPNKNFSSYFLTFQEGTRLELMHKPEILHIKNTHITEYIGIIHIAISVGSQKKWTN